MILTLTVRISDRLKTTVVSAQPVAARRSPKVTNLGRTIPQPHECEILVVQAQAGFGDVAPKGQIGMRLALMELHNHGNPFGSGSVDDKAVRAILDPAFEILFGNVRRVITAITKDADQNLAVSG